MIGITLISLISVYLSGCSTTRATLKRKGEVAKLKRGIPNSTTNAKIKINHKDFITGEKYIMYPPLDINLDDTVDDLKVRIEKLTEGYVNAEAQLLEFQGEQMENGKSLKDYKIENGITLNLTERPYGGDKVEIIVTTHNVKNKTWKFKISLNEPIGLLKRRVSKEDPDFTIGAMRLYTTKDEYYTALDSFDSSKYPGLENTKKLKEIENYEDEHTFYILN